MNLLQLNDASNIDSYTGAEELNPDKQALLKNTNAVNEADKHTFGGSCFKLKNAIDKSHVSGPEEPNTRDQQAPPSTNSRKVDDLSKCDFDTAHFSDKEPINEPQRACDQVKDALLSVNAREILRSGPVESKAGPAIANFGEQNQGSTGSTIDTDGDCYSHIDEIVTSVTADGHKNVISALSECLLIKADEDMASTLYNTMCACQESIKFCINALQNDTDKNITTCSITVAIDLKKIVEVISLASLQTFDTNKFNAIAQRAVSQDVQFAKIYGTTQKNSLFVLSHRLWEYVGKQKPSGNGRLKRYNELWVTATREAEQSADKRKRCSRVGKFILENQFALFSDEIGSSKSVNSINTWREILLQQDPFEQKKKELDEVMRQLLLLSQGDSVKTK